MTLAEGQAAPAFEGLDHTGKKHSLADYAGKTLILYFYPKDDTPGCTAEACNLRDNHQVLLDRGFAVLGVSPDPAEKHQKFIDKYELPFPLLCDTEKEILKAYEAWGQKNMYGKITEGVLRKTYLIEDGKIRKIFKRVKTKEHSEQILEFVDK